LIRRSCIARQDRRLEREQRPSAEHDAGNDQQQAAIRLRGAAAAWLDDRRDDGLFDRRIRLLEAAPALVDTPWHTSST